VAAIAVGHDANPVIADYVFELFENTSAAGRSGWTNALVNSLGPRHIGLDSLTVPTLVIGSVKDRLLPIAASRRIATHAPNLWSFVELGGGHCAILERPDEVNQQLRALLAAVS
jgi:pimeloyl-ACP methyl ester carboxylesterase